MQSFRNGSVGEFIVTVIIIGIVISSCVGDETINDIKDIDKQEIKERKANTNDSKQSFKQRYFVLNKKFIMLQDRSLLTENKLTTCQNTLVLTTSEPLEEVEHIPTQFDSGTGY